MSRSTAVLVLVTIFTLLVGGAVGFVMIGQQVVEREATSTATTPTTPMEPSDASSFDAGHAAPSTWEPHPTSTLPLKVLVYS